MTCRLSAPSGWLTVQMLPPGPGRDAHAGAEARRGSWSRAADRVPFCTVAVAILDVLRAAPRLHRVMGPDQRDLAAGRQDHAHARRARGARAMACSGCRRNRRSRRAAGRTGARSGRLPVSREPGDVGGAGRGGGSVVSTGQGGVAGQGDRRAGEAGAAARPRRARRRWLPRRRDGTVIAAAATAVAASMRNETGTAISSHLRWSRAMPPAPERRLSPAAAAEYIARA